MPLSGFLKQLRDKVGHDLLVLPSAAVAILDDAGRVLMGLHADKQIWVVPGGLIEPRETPADGAVRETFEETGLLIEVTGILGVYGGRELMVDYPNGDVASYIATIFRGRIISGELRPDGGEILDLRYFSREEIGAVQHSRWMDLAMDAIYAGQEGPAHFQKSTWQPQ
jgi:8-oxo-dGTP pyrophosphatase MutT (NUDIX family)